MTISTAPPTSADMKRWRRELSRLGPEGVRSRLDRATSLDPDEMVPVDDPPWPTRGFIEEWLRQTSRKSRHRDARRFWITIVIAAIGMVAACIAAWPVFKEWLAK